MGNLHEVIDQLKGMSVSVVTGKLGTLTPTVYDINEAKGHAQKSGLPLRYFSPFTDSGNLRATLHNFGPGNSSDVTWTITDRLLWRHLDGGIGIEDVANNLATYLDNYIDAAKALAWSGISTANDFQITGVDVTLRGDINFPAGSGQWYVGADAVWTIEEVDP